MPHRPRLRPGLLRPPRSGAGALLLAAALLASPWVQAAGPKPTAPKAVPAELPPETLTVATIDPKYAARVYVADVAMSHINDGRIRVFDAQGGKFLGMVSTGYVGNFVLSKARDLMYVATTHLSRSTRGERVDVLEVYDTQSLVFQYEVVLPPKRAQSLTYRGLVQTSGNGRFVLVMNATPATSVTVVDLTQRKVVAEVPTPGCWGVLPAATHGSRFSMLCGDGSITTLTLDDAGQVADRQVSPKLFDADADAWFHHAEQVGDRYWFLSFQGKLTELNLGGAVAQVVATRDLVSATEKKAGWRPGGYQNFAVDPSGRWLVAGMHPKGAEGSHKTPAAKLWVVDLASGQRITTLPGVMALALNFSHNGQRLQALDGDKAALHTWAWDAGRIRKLAYQPGVGEASLQIESQD